MWTNDQIAAAVADHRELALLDHLPLNRAGREPGPGAVEAAVAEGDPTRAGDRRFELLDRLERRTHLLGGLLVQRVVLGLDRAADPRVGPGREALRDEALDARLAGGREQVVSALGAQAVGGRERALELAQVEVAAERRHLVDDGVGPGVGHGGAEAVAVEAVDHYRLGAQLAQPRDLRRAAGGADDGVAVRGEDGG